MEISTDRDQSLSIWVRKLNGANTYEVFKKHKQPYRAGHATDDIPFTRSTPSPFQFIDRAARR